MGKLKDDYNLYYVAGDFDVPDPVMVVYKKSIAYPLALKVVLAWIEYINSEFNLSWRSDLLAQYEGLIDNNFLHLRIDLTYDETDLLKIIKESIKDAQTLIGKRPGKGRRTGAYFEEQYRLVKQTFLKHYKKAISANKAIINTVTELKELGHNIDADNIKRKYLPKLKNEYGVMKIDELKSLPGD